MALEIKIYPDPILSKRSEKVRSVTPEIRELISQMKETMHSPPSLEEGTVAAGLAANQVGVSQRVIVVNLKKELRGFVNPEIVQKSSQKSANKEGCLSLPKIWLEIKRPAWVKIKSLDEDGRFIEFKAEGFLATVFQHEIDHLDGKLFFERLPLLRRWQTKKKIDKIFAKEH